MTSFQNEKLKEFFRQTKKSFSNRSQISLKKDRLKSVHIIRENNWNNRFIYNKIPDYDSYKDKNVIINLNSKSYSNRNYFRNISSINSLNSLLNEGENSSFTPLTNNPNLKNDKKLIRTSSAKIKENILNDNLKYINIINLNNINKLWDELCVSKKYRHLFCVIYKELNDEDKQKIYQKEINELMAVKNDINILKTNIELRGNIIEDISKLNDDLNKEVINKNKDKKENIINEISKKIEILRERTINVCFSMKKLKNEIYCLQNLDKFNIDVLSEKFNFDKNYIIKMKGELKFLKEGFAKYYFNINNDQTPFLLNASDRNLEKIEKIEKNESDIKIHIIPLKKEMENNIIECIYYIYQELIAYQNEKVNKNILMRISPLKRKNNNNENNNLNIINGKEENILNNNLIFKNSSIEKNNLKVKNNKNYTYIKKKFLKIDKNGNNILLKQFKSHKNARNEKNKSIRLNYNNPLILPNNTSKENKKININKIDKIPKEKNISFYAYENKNKEEDKALSYVNDINKK